MLFIAYTLDYATYTKGYFIYIYIFIFEILNNLILNFKFHISNFKFEILRIFFPSCVLKEHVF